MQTVKLVALTCGLFFVVLPSAVAQEAGEPPAALLGKWEKNHTTAGKTFKIQLEFTRDLKVILLVDDLKIEGTYKVLDDKTLELNLTYEDKKKTDQASFVIVDDALELTDANKKLNKFTRVK